MKTIAIWYSTKKASSHNKVDLDLHFNLWKLYNKKTKHNEHFLDIGLMVSDISDMDAIFMYLPFQNSQFDIKDLGGLLLEHGDLVYSIFNEYYDITNKADMPKQIHIKDKENEGLFNVYKIDFLNDVKKTKKYGGTLIELDATTIKQHEQCKKYYFRTRLTGQAISELKRNYKPKSRFLQSAFSTTETLDFRVNEKRNYDPSLEETISNNQEFRIKKIHFLLLRSALDDFISTHIKASCRELEPYLWKKYVGEEYLLENILAYHWSKKTKGDEIIDSFNTLVKLKCPKSNWAIIFAYILVLGFLSISFNLISSWLFKIFTS